jgi:hypothetical protein
MRRVPLRLPVKLYARLCSHTRFRSGICRIDRLRMPWSPPTRLQPRTPIEGARLRARCIVVAVSPRQFPDGECRLGTVPP